MKASKTRNKRRDDDADDNNPSLSFSSIILSRIA
jgi:hypothetical protein